MKKCLPEALTAILVGTGWRIEKTRLEVKRGPLVVDAVVTLKSGEKEQELFVGVCPQRQ